MNDPIDTDDDLWLDVLAGKPSTDPKNPAVVEALAVRKALQARAQKLSADVPVADDALLEQLRFRLRRQRLSGKKTAVRSPVTWALAASVVLSVGLAVRIGLIDHEPPGTGVVDLGGIPPTTSEPEPGVHQPLAGATLVAAADPEAKAKQLIHGMPMKARVREQEPPGPDADDETARASWFDRFSWTEAKRSFEALSGLFREQVQSGVPVVIELGKDQIMLVIEATDAMIEYLRSQDIEPTVTDGEIIILIQGEEAPASPDTQP